MDTEQQSGAKIRVIGVGGGGGNAVNSMVARGLVGVEFIAANTDGQALGNSLAPTRIQVGKEYTRGLGAGADPSVGQRAIEETADEIREALANSDMVFVTAGMGGGTGTGGAPVVARISKEIGALVVGIVTKPFEWEAKKRSVIAENGIAELRKTVDALIVIPNQRLLNIIDKNTSFKQAFQMVDDVLYNATRGIADIISGHGYINVDFADVRTIMKDTGDALMGIGVASGEHRAIEAATNALNSPLLEGISIKGAQGLLINITAGEDVSMYDVSEAVQVIESAAGSDVNLIHGVGFSPDMGDKIMVTVVATGFKQGAAMKSSVGETHTANQIPQTGNVKAPELLHLDKEKIFQPNERTAPAAVSTLRPAAVIPVHQQTSGNSVRPLPESRPTGADSLRDYDSPAKERRNSLRGSIPISSINNQQDSGARDNEDRNTTQRPAFLRKIMD